MNFVSLYRKRAKSLTAFNERDHSSVSLGNLRVIIKYDFEVCWSC